MMDEIVRAWQWTISDREQAAKGIDDMCNGQLTDNRND